MKKVFIFAFLIVVCFMFTNVNASEVKAGTYKIVSALDNNKMLTAENGNIILKDDTSTGVTTWDVFSNGSTYYIKSHENNRYSIDIDKALLKNGSNIKYYTVNKTNAQKWYLNYVGNSYYYITSSMGNYNLDVAKANSNNGTNIWLYKNNGSAAQKWKFIRVNDNDKTLDTGIYIIKSKLNDLNVMDLSGAKTINQTNVQMYTNNYTWAQLWKVEYNDGYYTITSFLDNKKSLDIKSGNYKNKSNVWLYDMNSTNAQKFIIVSNGDGTYSIKNYDGLWSLDVASGSTKAGANVWLYNSNGTNAQKFVFEKVYVDPIVTGYYDINSILGENISVGINNPVLFNGKNVDLRINENHNTTKWYLKRIRDDIYNISISENTKYYLGLKGGNTASGTNAELNTSGNDNAQKWCIRKNDDGTYSIYNVKSNKVLDIAGAKSVEGTNIWVYNKNNSNAQKFKFVETSPSDYSMAYDAGKYVIKSSINNSMVVDISGAKKINGTNVQIYTSNSSKAQIWKLEYVGDGAYVIRSLINPNLVLSISGSNVVSSKYTKSNTQKWYFDKKNNITTIINMANGKYLNIASSNLTNSVNVSLSDVKYSTSEFILEKSTISNKYRGVDLSVFNKVTNWSALANEVDFAIIRAGFGEENISDGIDIYEDINYIQNVKKCEENNIPYALYFYSYANKVKSSDKPKYNETNIDSADSEAAHMLKLFKRITSSGYYPTLSTQVFYDQEESASVYNTVKKFYGESDSNNPKTRSLLTNIINEFCSTMNRNGYKCGIYSNANWLNNRINVIDVAKSHSVWVAEWPGYTTFNQGLSHKTGYNKTNYKVWQFTSSGSLSSISGRVDLDIGYDIFE